MTAFVPLILVVALPCIVMGYCAKKEYNHFLWLFGGPLLSLVVAGALIEINVLTTFPINAQEAGKDPHGLLRAVGDAYASVFGPMPVLITGLSGFVVGIWLGTDRSPIKPPRREVKTHTGEATVRLRELQPPHADATQQQGSTGKHEESTSYTKETAVPATPEPNRYMHKLSGDWLVYVGFVVVVLVLIGALKLLVIVVSHVFNGGS